MSKFESSVKAIPFADELVFNKVSVLSNLEGIKDKIPADKVQDLEFTDDSLTFSVSPIGKISLEVIERIPNSCVKYATTTSPIPFTLWVQILPVTENDCKIKVTIDAELNPFIKGMVKKPLMEGLEKMATMLSMIQY
ncbi:polyketide cyclase [Bacteroides propionicifaciens]|uniref:polyketide cyclase n=1 Tax=Bacteroides propionicifaciens TaxID=392838 RepID=UPI00036A85FE|nr:polyketide cyclase [Bacteroides propionicifaciens]